MTKTLILMKELSNPTSLIRRDMYEYYRQNRRKVAKGIDQYKLWEKAIRGLLIVLKEMVAENENGVYIEGFGYICVGVKRVMKKKVSLLKRREYEVPEITFQFDSEYLQNRYKFTTGKMIYILNRDLKYEPKMEAVKYIYNTKKIKWK